MISVCFSGNRKIFEGLLLSVMSMAKTASQPLDIWILTMSVPEQNPNFLGYTDAQIALLDKVVKDKNPQSRVRMFDVTDLYKKHLAGSKNAETGYTPYTLLRLLIDKLPDVPDKMIYIDVDTMCVSDIAQLWNVPLGKHDFAAAKDYMGRFWIRPTYCNAGVLLLNVKQMREDGLFEKCLDMVNRKKMMMPDQTALNKYGKKKFLPFRFNEQRKIKADTVVKHFCKGIVFFLPFGFHIYNIKQWQREKVHKSLKIFVFDDLYAQVDQFKQTYKECFENL